MRITSKYPLNVVREYEILFTLDASDSDDEANLYEGTAMLTETYDGDRLTSYGIKVMDFPRELTADEEHKLLEMAYQFTK